MRWRASTRITYAALPASDSGATTAIFGFGAQQDFGDASRVVAAADQGGLGLPDRDYYLKTDPKSVELRKQYQEHVRKMFGLLGEPAAQADKDAAKVLEIETALAKAAMDIVKRRDPANLNHKMKLSEMQALTPSFDWARYLKTVGAPAPQHYLVLVPEFFKALEGEIARRPIGEWQTYLRWHLLGASTPLLPKAIRDESFAFYGKTLAGQKEQRPRWKRCVAMSTATWARRWARPTWIAPSARRASGACWPWCGRWKRRCRRTSSRLDWMTRGDQEGGAGEAAGHRGQDRLPRQWRDYSQRQHRARATRWATRSARAPSSCSASSTRSASRSTAASGA